MSLKNTAGLAAMLMSVSLVPAAVHAADDWDRNYVSVPDDDGIVASSGTKESLRTETPEAGVYDYVTIGHAVYEGENASRIEASYNKGIIRDGVTAEGNLYGGRAYYYGPLQTGMTVEANGNTLVLQKGSNAARIYCGDAYDNTQTTGSVYACNNTVILESGGSFATIQLYGAFANSRGFKIASTSVASGNTVSISEGVTLESMLKIFGGAASDSSAEASGNRVYIAGLANDAQIMSVWAGEALSEGGMCTASNNVCELVLGNSVLRARSCGAAEAWNFALYSGDTVANGNILRVTGGTFAGKLFSGVAYSYGSDSYPENKCAADGNTAVLARVTVNKQFACGYAGFSGQIGELSASKNTVSITDSTMNTVYGGCVSGYSQFNDNGVYSESSKADENEVSVSGGTAGCVYAGYAFSASTASASGNRLVKIENAVITAAIYGGSAEGSLASATGNTGTLENVAFYSKADDASAGSTASGGSLADGTVTGFFAGGMAKATQTDGLEKGAAASDNKFAISGGTLVTVYGGCAESSNGGAAKASGNELVLNDAEVSQELYGGCAVSTADTESDPEAQAGSATAAGNRLEVTGGCFKSMYGGSAEGSTASATGNTGTLDNVSFAGEAGDASAGGVFAGGMAQATQTDGRESGAAASENKFVINGGTLAAVYGGLAESADGGAADSSGNELVLNDAEVSQELYGGCAVSTADTESNPEAQAGSATATGNRLVVTGGSFKSMYGGSAEGSTASATGNTGTLDNVAFSGGADDASADGTSSEGTVTGGIFAGGMASATRTDDTESGAAASENKFTITGGTMVTVYGGLAESANGATAKASGNELVLNDAVVSRELYGGCAVSAADTESNPEAQAGSATAAGNRLVVTGGSFKSMYGGSAAGSTASATGNTGTLDNVAFSGGADGASADGTSSEGTVTGGIFAGGMASATRTDGRESVAAASENKFTITGGTLVTVYGGLAESANGATAEASGNELVLNDAAVSKELYGGCAVSTADTKSYPGAVSGDASATGNRLAVTGGSFKSMYGGSAEGSTASATGNTGTLDNVAFASKAEDASAGGIFAGGMASATRTDGRESRAAASDNKFVINSGTLLTVYGGLAESANGATAKASGNELVLNDAEVSQELYGGCAVSTADTKSDPEAQAGSATAAGNRLVVTGGSFKSMYGGSAEGSTASATGNTGTLDNVAFASKAEDDSAGGVFAGGMASATRTDGRESRAAASDNKFVINSGTLLTVYGGLAESANGATAKASGNELVLNDAVVSQELYGGCAVSTADTESDPGAVSGDATAAGNRLVLNGGSFKDSIYGGCALATNSTAEAAGNVVILANGTDGKAPDLATATLYGGYAGAASGDGIAKSHGNALVFNNVSGMKAANIRNFQVLSYEYAELHAGDVILELSGSDGDRKTSIAGADVSLAVTNLYGRDGGVFLPGDKVVLLKNDNGIDADGITQHVTADTGAVLWYDAVVGNNEDNTEFCLMIRGAKARPGSKAIAEGAAAGLALATESSNAAAEALRGFSMASGTIAPFAHVQASSMRHETGSSVSVSTVSLVAGLGTGIGTGAGNISLGAFFEYGRGAYTTRNSSGSRSDIEGNGTSWYMGGGILARMDFRDTGPGHFYAEGAAHTGTVHNEYDSNDLADSFGNVARFDLDSPYYSLHGGLGYVWNMGCGHELDIFGRYLWTRVQGTDDTLTTGEKFAYDDMDSSRIRAGVRYSYTASQRFRPYAGIAYEHEFAGSCDSRVYGYDIGSPSFEGGSAIGELGIAMMPTEALPLSFNLGVQGYVGRKQGISGNCSFIYEF